MQVWTTYLLKNSVTDCKDSACLRPFTEKILPFHRKCAAGYGSKHPESSLRHQMSHNLTPEPSLVGYEHSALSSMNEILG